VGEVVSFAFAYQRVLNSQLDLVAMIDASTEMPAKRGPYKKRAAA
jgi:hypothetical protein